MTGPRIAMRVMTATATSATATAPTGIETATVTRAGMAPAIRAATVRGAMPARGVRMVHPHPIGRHGLIKDPAPRRRRARRAARIKVDRRKLAPTKVARSWARHAPRQAARMPQVVQTRGPDLMADVQTRVHARMPRRAARVANAAAAAGDAAGVAAGVMAAAKDALSRLVRTQVARRNRVPRVRTRPGPIKVRTAHQARARASALPAPKRHHARRRRRARRRLPRLLHQHRLRLRAAATSTWCGPLHRQRYRARGPKNDDELIRPWVSCATAPASRRQRE